MNERLSVSFPKTHCRVGVQALPASGRVSFGTSSHLSTPHFPHLLDRDDSAHLTGLKWRLTE